MRKPLRILSAFLQLLRIFFPGILFVLIPGWLFTQTHQGRDLIITALESQGSGFFIIMGLAFWVMVTWYTSRLIGYNKKIPSKAISHFPRLLGFSCFTVMTCGIANAYGIDLPADTTGTIVFASILFYVLLHKLFERMHNRLHAKRLMWWRMITWFWVLAITVIVSIKHDEAIYLLLLPLGQIAFLFLVVTRRKTISKLFQETETVNNPSNWQIRYREKIKWLFTGPSGKISDKDTNLILNNESSTLLYFNLLSLLALSIYLGTTLSIGMARSLTSIPILLLSFGILLGAGNILSLFTIKLKINFHFLVISLIVLMGFFRETHDVKLMRTERDLPFHATRPSLRPYFNHWLKARSFDRDSAGNTTFPVYLVLSDGGASRSAYWTATVLSRLDSLQEGGLYRNLFCLSGSSGGSLGNMAYLGSKRMKVAQESALKNYLSNDFLSFALTHLLGPDLILTLLPKAWFPDRAEALEQSMQQTGNKDSISLFMREGISVLNPALDSDFSTPLVFINCTRMQDGNPAVISNLNINGKVFGNRIDVLQQLAPGEDMSVATAVVLGARFPYFSPAGRIGNEYFVDAGYFDNSGAGVVHEMLLDLRSMMRDSLKANPTHPYSKIRFHVIHITNEPEKGNQMQSVHPLMNDLAAPISTITGSYARQTDMNNLRLQRYLQEIHPGENTYHRINLFSNGSIESYPMNWVMSRKAIGRMEERLKFTEF